jgi:hypothetical protein
VSIHTTIIGHKGIKIDAFIPTDLDSLLIYTALWLVTLRACLWINGVAVKELFQAPISVYFTLPALASSRLGRVGFTTSFALWAVSLLSSLCALWVLFQTIG